MSNEEPLDPSGIAQFVEHDRCPRYLKQRVDPGSEPDAREWREAYSLMNVALLGNGQEVEARQVEALATDATKVIGPDLDDRAKAGVPDITVDETWADSARGRTAQLHTAIDDAATRQPTSDGPPYILCYQTPLGGQLGEQEVWGELDCLVLAPTAAVPQETMTAPPAPAANTEEPTDTETETAATAESPTARTSSNGAADADVVARVFDIKSASEQQPAHRVQVAIYSALLERTLGEGPAPPCRIETSVLTQAEASAPGEPLNPFDLPTFPRQEWECFVEQLLAADGPIDDALTDDLENLPFALDQVCNNCAYREACATRAVEDPTDPASLALLGLDASVQRALQDAGVTNIRELSTLLPRQRNARPTDDPPTLEVPPDQQRKLEEGLPAPIHEVVQRAQALRGELDPDYASYGRPPALPGKDWIPLPDDRCEGWSNIDTAAPGELVHVALFVRPDTAINRIGALGACVYAEAHDEYHTVGEVIDAVPDDPDLATEVEASLFERFLDQLFAAIEDIARALGQPEETVIHCYTYSDHAKEALAEGLDRHADSLDRARALRAWVSLHPEGHTDDDQSMVSPVQPVLNKHFALKYPSQGLLAVAEQFVPGWTVEALDPLDARGEEPPLRAIFREQFIAERVPYLDDDPGIRLHLARGPLGEGPAAAVTDADHPTPDGWYPIRKRAGGQFPLEYIWAVTPNHPDESTPRLTPDIVEEWAVDEDHEPLYRQEIGRFYYRTTDQSEPLRRDDVEYLVERLSYALMRLVESIPYKDAYHPKEPLDATSLGAFDLPVNSLPEAARDYLRMEFGAKRDRTLTHYRQSLRERARSGRSIPIRCTAIDQQPDGSLTIDGEVAYGVLFDDEETATQVARQARLRSGDGPGGGSWRVITGLDGKAASAQPPSDHADGSAAGPSPRDGRDAALTVDDPEDIKHSPPVLVEDIDTRAGTVTLSAFFHRFGQSGSVFRADHCGWQSPDGSNLTDPDDPPAERPGYVADREPVWIDTGEVYLLDPMVDDFSGPKAERALQPETVEQNALWRHLRLTRTTGQQPSTTMPASGAIERFLDTMADVTGLDPNERQRAFIRATDRVIVPLQGPPGTGKTSGATAPALLARAYAHAQHDESFVGVVVAPAHEAVDTALGSVVDLLDDWRTETGGLPDLRLVRVLPAAPPETDRRADATATRVDVTYANYHSDAGESALETLTSDVVSPADTGAASQCLLFVTPATLYRTLGIVAETCAAIDGDTAPAAMRHADGLADVVCVDEASMLDIPQLLLAGSVLKPTGQTLLVGDHRQLATVTEVDWKNTLRKPLKTTSAYRSALEYIQWLNATRTPAGRTPPSGGDGA